MSSAPASGVVAVSDEELRAETSGEGLPPLAAVRDWLHVLPQALASTNSPRYTLSYLVLDDAGGVHVIDPGWDSEENRERLESALDTLGRSVDDVRSTISTHLHRDHLGLAEHLRERVGAQIVLHEREQSAIDRLADVRDRQSPGAATARLISWGVPAGRREALEPMSIEVTAARSSADRLVVGGELLDVPGRRLEVLDTPGHTPGHIAVVVRDESLVFTGDHLLPSIFGGIGLGGPVEDAIGDHLESLGRLEELEPGGAYASDGMYQVLPGHGYRFTGLAARVQETREHHLARSAEVAALLEESSGASVWQVAEGIRWSAGWANLRPFHRFSALAQTAMHVNHLRLAAEKGVG
ncbi:MBL fold metallo-hydrolase [Herbiconiux sp. CPCC 205716]|uniref:MBL fold metallo-hydrolase n=1 Tax=Herbiconiux gentiana TaxID=2970912 RepID=A0ABT2GM45_9MICO|nr:MBL fold metallo-hydrolase [Herbiconiux gentiana]MCS5715831.1 MBL fold metallo-hydrolase [Herbiconiux gentiana]